MLTLDKIKIAVIGLGYVELPLTIEYAPVYSDFRSVDVRHSPADISKAQKLLAKNQHTK